MSTRKGVMVQRVADTISVSKQEKVMAQRVLEKMGNFQSTCPKASIKVISEYHDFGTCIFGH